MAVRTYDSKQVILTIGAHAVTGYAEDDFISVEENSDGVTHTVGANGELARSISQDKTCKITITLQQTSPTNDVLSALADADRVAGDGLFAIAMADLRGTSLLLDSNSWVIKKPETSFGKEIKEREWTIQTSNEVTYNVGGNGI